MLNFNNLYRWCDAHGGGIVVASSLEEATEKLTKKYGDERGEYIVWPWANDDYFDEENPDVLDVYN